MFEKRAEQNNFPGNPDAAARIYVEPSAEWHDLRVITLGGPSGTGDSGAEGVQQDPSRTHYDEKDDDYGNYA